MLNDGSLGFLDKFADKLYHIGTQNARRLSVSVHLVLTADASLLPEGAGERRKPLNAYLTRPTTGCQSRWTRVQREQVSSCVFCSSSQPKLAQTGKKLNIIP